MREKPAASSRSADIGGAFRQPPCGFAMLAEQQLFRLGSVLLAPMSDDACATTSRALAARSAAASLLRSAAAAVRTFAATIAARDRSPAGAEEPAAVHDGRGVANTDTRISSDGLAAASAKAMTDEAGPLAGQGAPQSTPKLCRAISALRDPPRAGGAYPPFSVHVHALDKLSGLRGCFLTYSLSQLLPAAPRRAAQLTMASILNPRTR